MRDDCVRVLTAHRSKGLEWDVVVVAGVQEEIWPDLRLRGSLLGADELAEVVHQGLFAPGRPGEVPGRGLGADVDAALLAAKLLAEERRLFYVAVTRARRRLVVTAAGGADTDQRPSRFLTELAGDDVPPSGSAAPGCTAGCPCRPWSRTCAGPPPTAAARWPSGRPPRPSWPGWPRPESVPLIRGTGTR